MRTGTGVREVGDALSRNYTQLTGAERFTLMLEAMARGDEAEADRLEDSCPKLTYRHNDAEFRDRLQRSYVIALLACLNLQRLLAVVTAGVVFRDQHRLYARGPTLVATCAFLYGRQYGMWECGAIERIEPPNPDRVSAEVEGRPDLKQQLRELREIAEEGVLHVADAMQESIGLGVAVEALSQWEGFSRFCRQHLGVEPLTLMTAYGLGLEDPAAEVLAAYPDAVVDETKAAHWEGNWAREWERRFERQQ
jgi:hypothetical protein